MKSQYFMFYVRHSIVSVKICRPPPTHHHHHPHHHPLLVSNSGDTNRHMRFKGYIQNGPLTSQLVQDEAAN